MTLRARIAALLVVLGAILLGSAVTVSRALVELDEEREVLQVQLQPGIVDANDLSTAVVNQETGERGFVITADEAFLDPYRAGRVAASAELAALRETFTGNAPVQSDLDAVEDSIERWQRGSAAREIAAVRAGDRAGAEELVRTGVGKQAFDQIRADIDVLQVDLEARLADAQERSADALDRVVLALAATAVLLLVLLVVTGLLLRSWVLVPVTRLLDSMRVVADDDLSQPVAAVGPPEVAAIGRGAEKMRRRIVSELDAARAATEALGQESPLVVGLQRELQPSSHDDLDGVTVHGVLSAAEGVLAGDWWDAVRRPDGRTVLMVADVSGHGPDACLVAARFKQRLTLLLQTNADLLLALTLAAHDLDPDPERFLSCVLVEVDARTGELRWINAGHGGAVVMRRQRSVVEGRELGPTGPLVGSVAQSWTVGTTRLDPDQMVLLTTDGVTEARQQGEGEFGVEGVFSAVRAVPGWSPEEVVPEIVQAVRQFADDWRRDDATCVALMLTTRRQPETRPEPVLSSSGSRRARDLGKVD